MSTCSRTRGIERVEETVRDEQRQKDGSGGHKCSGYTLYEVANGRRRGEHGSQCHLPERDGVGELGLSKPAVPLHDVGFEISDQYTAAAVQDGTHLEEEQLERDLSRVSRTPS